MKTKALSMMGLGLAVVCLCLAPQSSAIKGGIPANPGEEDPPPEPTTPIVYQPVDIQLQPQQLSDYRTGSINDEGVVAGAFATKNYPESNGEFTVRIPPDMNTPGTVNYWADDVVVLEINETTAWMGSFTYINNSSQVAGAFFTWADVASTNYWFEDFFHVYTNELFRAVLWNSDGSRHDLWSPTETDLSRSCAINDAGWVVIVNCEDEAVYTKDNWGSTQASYVVVPDYADSDGDGNPWYADTNPVDGTNDLALLIDSMGYHPEAINESGQIVFSEGVVLTPAEGDSDGDGNSWYADTDPEDGINDLLKALWPLEDYGAVRAMDINDLGQIVGYSTTDWYSQALFWENDVVRPVALGKKPTNQTERTYATGINNTGQIIGYYYEKVKGGGTNPNQTQGARGFLFQDEEIYCFSDITTDGSITGRPQDINNNGWILSGSGAVYIPVVE